MPNTGLKGQSAIEYLMTYGWMLLVVAVVGAAIFAVAQGDTPNTVSGFTGANVIVEDFGITTNDELELVLRNAGGQSTTVNSVNVSDGSQYTAWTGSLSLGVADADTVTLANVSQSDGAETLDIDLNYDRGALTNLEISGTISGGLELTEEASLIDQNGGENGDGNGEPFVLTVDTEVSGDSGNDQFEVLTGDCGGSCGGDFDYSVSVNGSVTNSSSELSGLTGDALLEWDSPGVYQVNVSGDFPHMQYPSLGESYKILSVDQWGNIEWGSMYEMFYGAENMEGNFEDEPDLENVQNMGSMFRWAVFDGDLSGWDTSNVEDMSSMFRSSSFNGSISGWDVSNVQDMWRMFQSAGSFDQDISGWNPDIDENCDPDELMSDCGDFASGSPIDGDGGRTPYNWYD